MLTLSSYLTQDRRYFQDPNLTDAFCQDDLDRIGVAVWEGYDADAKSCATWLRRTESAMDLALQIQRTKSFPWPDCSNVAFPLVTIAALQFHARAYPAIVGGTSVVKCRVIGEDPDGKKTERAHRVSAFMSYQVLEEDESWEELHDRLLINIAVVGTAFIKTYYSASKGHNVSELVPARNLVMNYWSKSVEDSQRKTEIVELSRNDVHERVLRGVFHDVLEDSWYCGAVFSDDSETTGSRNLRTGTNPPQFDTTTPLICLEQHVSLDLDNDGYAEPYIITIAKDSKKVLRIVPRFDREEDIERVKHGNRTGQIIRVRSREYYTKYGFIPSPDGGIYDVGFGVLTGPLNETVNTLINQLIDAGTMANGGGGFLGRGVKFRGGAYSFAPGEWKRTDTSGDDLHKNIVPLPVREPSNVLFQLLGLLIDYTNRISGSTDMMVGENPGQNTPAETSRTMVEQGAKIYTAIFKRIWRSMREEFKKLFVLNGLYLPPTQPFGHAGLVALREDYNGDSSSIAPVADPNIASEGQRQQLALLLKQNAHTTPGYNLVEVEKRFLSALHVDGVETLYPGPDKTPPLPNPKLQVEQAKVEMQKLQLQAKAMMFVMEMEEARKVNEANIIKLHASAALALEQAGGIRADTDIAQFEATLSAMKAHDESLGRQAKLLLEGIRNDQQGQQAGGTPRTVPGMGTAPDNKTPENNAPPIP